MKNSIVRFLAIFIPMIQLLVLLSLTGCLSFKTNVPSEPELSIDFFSVINNLNNKTDLNDVIKDKVISSINAQIFAIVKVKNINQTHHLEWRWYQPDRNLIRKSERIRINAQNKYLEYFVAWDILDNKQFKDKKGNWTVTIFIDDLFFANKVFKIN